MTCCYLDPARLEAFFRFHYPDDAAEVIRERTATFTERLRAGQRDLRDSVLLLDDHGEMLWSFVIFPQEEGACSVQPPSRLLPVDVSVEAWRLVAQRVADRLRERGAKRASLRFPTGRITQALPPALVAAGFHKRQDRIEFKTPLADLPGEAGTPLQWRPVGEGIDLEFAAKIMTACAPGDPCWDPNESALESIRADLRDEVLYTGLDAIHVGFLGAEPAAFVFAQVDPRSGWSRITYMGLAPAHRGRGLGRWVHRHGFEMMRRQGGVDYHGGTAAENGPMIATFRAHGCAELRRMEEWQHLPPEVRSADEEDASERI